MPKEIPDLWGHEIDVSVVPPLVILRTQAELIGRRTKGLLTAEVVTSSDGEEQKKVVAHQLLLRAPSIGYAEHLLSLTHSNEKLYPVAVQLPVAISWLPGQEKPVSLHNVMAGVFDPASPRHSITCNDQDGLLNALRVALTSPPTKAALNSLLARVNETQLAKS